MKRRNVNTSKRQEGERRKRPWLRRAGVVVGCLFAGGNEQEHKIRLVLIAAWSGIMFLTSVAIVIQIAPIDRGSFYSATFPFIVSAGVVLVIAMIGVVVNHTRVVTFWISAPMLLLLVVPWRQALYKWGGEPQAGLHWLVLVGLESIAASVLAMVLIIYTLVTCAKQFPERMRLRRIAIGLCPDCGYDLRGADHGKCPECGKAVVGKRRQPNSSPRRVACGDRTAKQAGG